MNQIKNLQKLNNLPFFDKNTLSQVVIGKQKAISENIYRWLKNEQLIQLKKGMYVTSEYIRNLKDLNNYLEYLSNNLRTPSYLSLEYVLQKYNVLTESVFFYTSISLKKKRIIKNQLGAFSYRQIKKSLFLGYEYKDDKDFSIYEASMSKALFDYLYLKFYKFSRVTKKDLILLRLNLDILSLKDRDDFSKYTEISDNKIMKQIYDLLFIKKCC